MTRGEGSVDFTGKVAVVTGGGTGLGQAIARELSSLGRTATTHRIDVADEAGVEAGFDEIVRVHGGIDYLVNNAGTTAYVPFEDVDGLTGEVWDRILGVNVKGAFFCARA